MIRHEPRNLDSSKNFRKRNPFTIGECRKNKKPNCEQVQKSCDLHRQWLCLFWPEGIYSKTAHKALGNSYVSDSRFKAYYDQLGEDCANFFRDALDTYCSK
ncbi:MAG: TipAS antibiotic-recognition domain-containing protein [Clostridium sp.]|nr:TipAS antibiotic-recognition domain-containing protein [Clostridium sp.]